VKNNCGKSFAVRVVLSAVEWRRLGSYQGMFSFIRPCTHLVVVCIATYSVNRRCKVAQRKFREHPCKV